MKKNTIDLYGPEYVVEVKDVKLGMEGFLVIHNTALGPGKGGIRMTPDVTVEEVKRLASTMTWKNSLAGIPFGGALFFAYYCEDSFDWLLTIEPLPPSFYCLVFGVYLNP